MGDVVEFEKLSQEDIRGDLRQIFQGAIRVSLEMLLEEEVKSMVGAGRYERALQRHGARNGGYMRSLLTSMGHIDVRVPRTRDGSAVGVIGAYDRRSDDVDAAITEAYVSGVSHRKMGNVTEALMGERVSKSTVSRVAKRLERTVEEMRSTKLTQGFPYIYLDATFIDARWARRVENVAALVAYGVGDDGFRHLLGVHLGFQESEASWSELLQQLTERGLHGVGLVISDDHAGLKAAVRHWLPEAKHQRCTVHLQRNVMAKIPRRLQSRVVKEISEIFKAPSKLAASEILEAIQTRWTVQLPEAMECLQKGFTAATVFYEFPVAHWQRIRTTNGIERLNLEIKRRTRAVGSFPDRESALRLICSVAIKTCAVWGDKTYLDMKILKQQEGKIAA